MKKDFFDADIQDFEAKNGSKLKEEWIKMNKDRYREFVIDNYFNEAWNNLSEDQKTEIALKAHGNDTPRKRNSADVDGISSYSCISKTTKKYFQSLKQ